MREYYLQMAWKLSVLAGKKLITVQGDSIEILYPGYGPSNEGGPDFTMAKIKLKEALWVGSVEVHVKSSMWYSHGHAGDFKYDNVILHVVWEQDKPVMGNQGGELPCIELKNYLPSTWLEDIEQKIVSQQTIPCASYFSTIPRFIFNAQLDVMLVERIEDRVAKIEELYHACNANWDECLHRFTAHFMGQKANNKIMEELASSIPLQIISKHRNSLVDIEALLFGQGGFLEEELTGTYFQTLKERYIYLAHKYCLSPVYGINKQWEYKSVRPAAFPERCIAKWAYLLYTQERLLNWIVNEDMTILIDQSLDVGEYWKTHYRFESASSTRSLLKKTTTINLCINAVIPFRIAYKRFTEQIDVSAQLVIYEVLKPEKNAITESFKALGYSSSSARDTQALLQLYNNYCNYRKCLSCKVGHFILKKEGLI